MLYSGIPCLSNYSANLISLLHQFVTSVCARVHLYAGQGTLPEDKAKQMFKMARDCLDRGEDIYSTARKEQRPLALFRLATPSPIASPTLCNPPIPPPPPPATSSTSSYLPISRPHSQTLSGRNVPSRVTPSSATPPQKTTMPPIASGSSNKARGSSATLPNHSRLMSWPASQKKVLGSRTLGRVRGTDGVDGTQGSLGQRSSATGQGHVGKGEQGHGATSWSSTSQAK